MNTNRKKGIVVMGISILVVLVSLVLPVGKGLIDNGNRIARNEFGEGEINVALTAKGEEEIELTYSVSERRFSGEEAERMLPDFLTQLEQLVLGTNVSPDAVCMNLNFAEEVDGYPFYVEWSTDHPELIGSKGNIKESIKEPVEVIVTAKIEYLENNYEHSFPVVLVEKPLAEEEAWLLALENSLEQAHTNTLEAEYFILPEKVEGVPVKWSEKKEYPGVKVGVLGIMIGILFFFSDEIQRREDRKKRLERIQKDYPEFAIKCSMMIGAGMTMRQTFEKLGRVYLGHSEQKKPLYEEVVIGLRELESGMPERQVYESFGRRCGIRETERFGSLMSRNLRKGSEGLKGALRDEAEQAMERHKEEIRKQGETAGTKLLFPMLILLLIVMVIIMIPAFSTFSI